MYPEDIENALRTAGIRDSVVIETRPGRIEAVVLAPGDGGRAARRRPVPGQGVEAPSTATPTELSGRDRRGRQDRPTRRLAQNQRVVAWRLWPDADFPRTHTLKVKRDRIRAWAGVEQPLPIDAEPVGTTPLGPAPRRSGLADDRDLDPEVRRAPPPRFRASGSGGSAGVHV